ncbi:MAG: energy-coupling factor transporter ATPase [Treponema sp.]|nr:energy-coupling factor transporter ATPase [Treponema sp.]
MSILSVNNVTYSYPQHDVPAVKNISFSLESGSYTAIVGLNGSGKSTLARILSGLLDADEGSVRFTEGKRTALVFQSPKDQIICGIVSRDAAFGPQNLGLDAGEVELRTIESLNITGLLSKASSPSMALSLGQTQKEAIAGIIALRPDVLILDEAVAMLDPESRSEIFHFLLYWVSLGNTVIHITHDTDAVQETNDVILMKAGEIVFQGSKNDFFADVSLCSLITGSDMVKSDRTGKSEKKAALVFSNVSFSYGGSNVISSVNFSLHKGTLTALTGISGSGKSTLLEIAAGLLIPDSGTVQGADRPVLCQQNSEAALFEQFAADDVAFGLRNKGVSGNELVTRVTQAMDEAGIPFSLYADRQTFNLSGGEKRRLAVAGIIVLGSPVILFDEPTAGLDGPSRSKVMNLLRTLAEKGSTVMFSTHHRDEADFADREIVLADGIIRHDTFAALPDYQPAYAVQQPLDGVKLLDMLRKTAAEMNVPEKNTGIIARMAPVAKFLVFSVLFISSLVVRPLYACIVLFCVSFVYALLSGYPVKRLFFSLIKVIPLLLFFCIFQMIFYPAVPGERVFIPYRYFTVTPSKLMLCLTTLIHTEAALACIIAFTYTTPEYDIVDGLSVLLKPLALLHVPVRYIIVVIEIVFRFIPLLLDEAAAIIKTQLIRGGLGKAKGIGGRIKAVLPLFVPLVIQTVKRSESLADALTERCFS